MSSTLLILSLCTFNLTVSILEIIEKRQRRRKWIVCQPVVIRYDYNEDTGTVTTVVDTVLRVIVAKTREEAIVKFMLEMDRIKQCYKYPVEHGLYCYNQESIIAIK